MCSRQIIFAITYKEGSGYASDITNHKTINIIHYLRACKVETESNFELPNFIILAQFCYWYKIQVTRYNSDPIISALLQRSSEKPSNNQHQRPLAAMITSGQHIIFVIIAKLKRQSKPTDIDSIHAHVIKTVDFEEITEGNLQERMNSLISDGKVINRSNRNKYSYWINLDLVDITTASTLTFFHDFLPNAPTVAHFGLLSSPTIHSELTANGPTLNFTLSQKLLQVLALKELK